MSTDKHYHGHRARLRERMSKHPHDLQDYEVLELLLGKVLTRKDTKPLAKELLLRFQNIRGVLDAKPAELLSVEGFGPVLAHYWVLLRELMARYEEAPLRRKEVLSTPEQVARAAKRRLAGHDHEEVWIAFVDAQNHLLSWEFNHKGSVDNVAVYTRDILERGLLLKAMGFILVHNHPSGNSSPSGADLEITAMLKRAAQSVEMRFIDHIIVTDTDCYSVSAEGLI